MIVCFVGKGIWLIVEKSLLEHGVIEPEKRHLDDSQENNQDDSATPSEKVTKVKERKAKRKLKPESKYGMQPYQYVHTQEPGKQTNTLMDLTRYSIYIYIS